MHALGRLAGPVASAGRAAARLGALPVDELGRAGLGGVLRAADRASHGLRRTARATLLEREALDAYGRTAALALARLETLTRPRSRAPATHPERPSTRGAAAPPAAPRGEPAEPPRTAASREPAAVSPELALVDPELAARARLELHAPGAFLPGRTRSGERDGEQPPPRVPPVLPLHARRGSPTSAELVAHTSVCRVDRFFEPVPADAPSLDLPRATLVAAAAASVVGIGAAVASLPADRDPGGQAGDGRAPAAAELAAQTVRPRASSTTNLPPAQARGTPTTAPSATTPDERVSVGEAARSFAWVPAPDASGYEIQLFKGAERVYARRVTEPRVDIGPAWRHEGETRTLEPGTYRWYVWAVGPDGNRSDTALVQTRVVIGR